MISEQIDQSLKEAMYAHQESEVSTLRYIKSVLKNASIDQQKELAESDVINILRREVKKRREAIEQYKQGSRPELAEKEQSEISIIEKFLPSQASNEEINKVIDEVITNVDLSDQSQIGKVIGLVMAKIGSRADGSLVAELVKARFV